MFTETQLLRQSIGELHIFFEDDVIVCRYTSFHLGTDKYYRVNTWETVFAMFPLIAPYWIYIHKSRP